MLNLRPRGALTKLLPRRPRGRRLQAAASVDRRLEASSRHSSRESARRQPEDLPVASDVTAQTGELFQ